MVVRFPLPFRVPRSPPSSLVSGAGRASVVPAARAPEFQSLGRRHGNPESEELRVMWSAKRRLEWNWGFTSPRGARTHARTRFITTHLGSLTDPRGRRRRRRRRRLFQFVRWVCTLAAAAAAAASGKASSRSRATATGDIWMVRAGALHSFASRRRRRFIHTHEGFGGGGGVFPPQAYN